MSAMVVLMLGLVVLGLAWRVGLGAISSPVALAVVATLAMLGTVFNIVVPVANVEATTALVACTAIALRVRSAMLVGVLAVLGTGAVSGIGPWTGWQVAGFMLVAVGAAAASHVVRRAPRAWRWPLLAASVGLLTVAFDVVVTVPSLALATGSASSTSLGGALLLGLPFTITHVVGNVVIFIVIGPSLLHALGRARSRMEMEPGLLNAPSG